MTSSTLDGTPLQRPAPATWIPGPARSAWICFLLVLAMNLPWLGCTPIAGTEAHRIFPAHEMVRSGNWLVPMLFGKPLLTKPPLHHWLIAVSEMTGSSNPNLPNDPTPRDLFLWRLPSTVMGAALCAIASLFGARWFGHAAGLISGLAAVGMIAIWGQAQVADIDSTNTFAAAFTAYCGIELLIGCPARKWGWVALASVGMTAIWMTKGPAGLTIVAGVWIYGAVVAKSRGEGARLASPGYWLPLVLGLAAFGFWSLDVKARLVHSGMMLDKRGTKEVTDLLVPKSIKAVLAPLYIMLPQLFAFGLPVSASLLFFRDPSVRRNLEPAARAIARGLAAAVLISWGLAVISGIVNPLWTNPRYFYPTLLLLCPLTGAVAVTGAELPRIKELILVAATATAIGLAAGATALAAASWQWIALRPLMIAVPLAAGFVLGWTVYQMRTSWSGAWGLVVLVLLTSVSFGAQRHVGRTFKDSGYQTAQKLRRAVGEHTAVAIGEAGTSKPETFTYSHVEVIYFPEDFLPQKVPPRTWVVLNQEERRLWLRQPGVRLEREQKLCRNGDMDYYLAWYAGMGGK